MKNISHDNFEKRIENKNVLCTFLRNFQMRILSKIEKIPNEWGDKFSDGTQNGSFTISAENQ